MGKAVQFLVVAVVFLGAQITRAGDLDAAFNRSILDALVDDNSRSDIEKLFDDRCQTIKDTVGFEEGISGQAREYSCDVAGIGVTLYVGEDLGKHDPAAVAKHFTDYLTNKRGIPAKAFIKKKHPYGTSMAFYVNGQSWLLEPVNPLQANEKLEALSAEAKLILFTQKRVAEWIYDSKGQTD